MCLETVYFIFNAGGNSDFCAFLLPFLLLGSFESLEGLAKSTLCPLLGFINI